MKLNITCRALGSLQSRISVSRNLTGLILVFNIEHFEKIYCLKQRKNLIFFIATVISSKASRGILSIKTC